MNNAVYRKTMENLRNRIDVKFLNNEKGYFKQRSKPNYILQKIFDDDLVAIRKIKVTLKLNKPAYVGICISDFSKVLICEFNYDYVENKYGNNSNYYSLILIV